MTNIFLVFLIAGVLYLMLVFTAPNISSRIDESLGIEGTSDNIRGTKKNIDTAITDIPSVTEFREGAEDIKQKVVGGIETTKDTIDTIRSSGQKIEEGYNTVVETYDRARDIVDTASERVEEIQGVINTVNQITSPQAEAEVSSEESVKEQ